VRRDAAIASGFLHVAVVALAYFGLPALFHPEPVEDSGPVAVEVVTAIDPAPRAARVARPAPDPPPPKPPPPPVERAAPKPEPVKEAKIPPPPKHKPKPPPPSLASLLKDIRKDLKTAPETPAKKPAKPKERLAAADLVAGLKPETPKAAPATLPSALSQRESSLIAERVRAQITPCWAVPAGAKDARDMRIGIHIALNPDGSLRGVPSLADPSRMAGDPVFRAFAESALRAIQNPRCSPLKLPTDRYSVWSEMTIVFDPRELVGP
jgi:outer membrane biosynthesis protein TonB